MTNKIRAWDHFHLITSHITRIGWTGNESKLPLEREHMNTALEKLYGANLTVEQIHALNDVVYYAYQLGKKANDC